MNVSLSHPVSEKDLASLLAAYNDVTERLKRSHESLVREVGRLRRELQEKNRELARRERLSALGEMAAGLAHEIRNPLGGIGLYVSLLERDLADRPRLLEIVRKMGTGVRNLEGIVSDILAFAGDARPRPVDVSAAQVATSAVEQVEPKASLRGVSLKMGEGLEEATLHADAAQVERALINLLVNAIEVTPRGGTVRILADRDAGPRKMTRIVVLDDGPGIPADLLQRIFNPFFTTKDAGTGLGLAIVHRIAEANGGSITAANRTDGDGAMFVLSLPTGSPAREGASSTSRG
ncbi:MAG: sensor histidine kinase [Planctomycetota bacterium]|nr:MAG: sensor histidine kinase [Planctomycetota bacterium]